MVIAQHITEGPWINQSTYILILTCGCELITDHVSSLCIVARLSPFRDRVRRSVIWEQRRQLRRHLVRIPPVLPPVSFSWLWGRRRTHWSYCVSLVAWKHLGICPEELEEVARSGGGGQGYSALSCCHSPGKDVTINN